MRDPEDRPLVDGLRRGDGSAFDATYAKFRARVFGFLLRLCRRRDLAEELTQETWLRFARTAPRLDPDTDLQAFLFTVARNAWVSHRRWNLLDLSRLVALEDDPGWREALPEEPRSQEEDRVDARRVLGRIERALGEIPAASREVLILIGIEGFDHERAAQVLGVNGAALRQRLSRARERLARALAELPNDV